MIYYETELYHHGVKGMKWGVRRYQKKDGTRTPLGKKRERKDNIRKAVTIGGAATGAAAAVAAAGYGLSKQRSKTSNSLRDDKFVKNQNRKENSNSFKEKFGKLNEPNIKGGKDKPNKSPLQVFTKESENALRGAQDILKAANRNRKSPNNAEGISDAELRKRINRIKLENEYNNLTKVDVGMDKALTALEIIGGVVAIGASAATIASTVKGMK